MRQENLRTLSRQLLEVAGVQVTPFENEMIHAMQLELRQALIGPIARLTEAASLLNRFAFHLNESPDPARISLYRVSIPVRTTGNVYAEGVIELFRTANGHQIEIREARYDGHNDSKVTKLYARTG